VVPDSALIVAAGSGAEAHPGPGEAHPVRSSEEPHCCQQRPRARCSCRLY
jgi:hypothetical protein